MGKEQVYQRKRVCSPEKEDARQIKDVYYIRAQKIVTWAEMVAAEMAKVCKIFLQNIFLEKLSWWSKRLRL